MRFDFTSTPCICGATLTKKWLEMPGASAESLKKTPCAQSGRESLENSIACCGLSWQFLLELASVILNNSKRERCN